MSFVTSIRDYVEALNTISDSLGQNVTLPSFLSETFIYILKTCQSGLIYILSFRWIRDFTLLPLVLPQTSSALLKEIFFLENPSKIFFDFLEIPDLHQNKFLLGFFNSFFLSLPISVIHIIAIRRLLIKGIPAGVYTFGGYILGQLFFIACTVFGIRQLLIPWLTLEPLNYLIGIILVCRIIYSMNGESLTQIKGWVDPQYKTFFLTSFLIAWCEQTSVFQYLGNLTLSPNVTLLESFSSATSLFTHFFYLIGIAIGSILFSCFWGGLLLQVKNWFLFYTPIFTSSFIQVINKTSFILALALSFTSIPFYGVEYLFTGPFGFVSQDTLFKNTVLDQPLVKDYAKGLATLSGPESQFNSIDLELSPFDRGEYLTAPSADQQLSFEDLNYRGEFDWTTRTGKLSDLTAPRGGFFSLSQLFKKQNKQQQQPLLPQKEKFPQNSLLLEKDNTLLSNELDTLAVDPEVVKRYRQVYGANPEDIDKPLAYQQLYFSSFPDDYLRNQSKYESNIEQKIKDNYYSNPVYKSLLTLDIDLFLKRQPHDFQLSADHEIDLYTKRKMLELYSNSLKTYSQLPFVDLFDSFFDGAKSFSTKVYNQQFKGTLRSVRRLFTLRVNPQENFCSLSDAIEQNKNSNSNILKFDLPLYQFSQIFSPYHEECSNFSSNSENGIIQNEKNQSFQEKSMNTYELDFDNIEEKNQTSFDFLSLPLYAGWDESERKFVITNKFLPRKLAGYKVNIESKTRQKSIQDPLKQSKKTRFTVWPLPTKKLQQSKNESSIPYVTLFQPLDEKAKTFFSLEDFRSLPANFEKWEYQQSFNEKGKQQKLKQPSLAPRRGGFIWPGHSKLKLSSQLDFLLPISIKQ